MYIKLLWTTFSLGPDETRRNLLKVCLSIKFSLVTEKIYLIHTFVSFGNVSLAVAALWAGLIRAWLSCTWSRHWHTVTLLGYHTRNTVSPFCLTLVLFPMQWWCLIQFCTLTCNENVSLNHPIKSYEHITAFNLQFLHCFCTWHQLGFLVSTLQ